MLFVSYGYDYSWVSTWLYLQTRERPWHWRCVRGLDQSALGDSDTPTSDTKLPRSENELDLWNKWSKYGIIAKLLLINLGYLIVGTIIEPVGRMQMTGKYLDSEIFDHFCRHFFVQSYLRRYFAHVCDVTVKGHRRVYKQCDCQLVNDASHF